MNTVETIQTKLIRLPLEAQEEVLEAVEEIEVRYRSDNPDETNGGSQRHVLELLAEIKIDGPADLATRHDYYAHRKVED